MMHCIWKIRVFFLYIHIYMYMYMYIYIPNLFPELTFYERVKYLPVVKVNILVHLFVNY